jgi:inorganic pyrophosphatase
LSKYLKAAFSKLNGTVAGQLLDWTGSSRAYSLDEDGDELDTLIVCDEPLPTGIWLEAKILGVMNFQDDGEADHKVVVRAADDRNDGDWLNSLDDLGERWKQMIEHHFTHYKDLKKPGSTKVEGWGDAEAAKQIISECIERYKQQ